MYERFVWIEKMAKEDDDMKKKRRLQQQVLVIMLAFYAVGMVIGILTVYFSSRNTYLTAKNDMIERDLKRVDQTLMEWPGMRWFFEYSKQHAQEIKQEMTTDELAIMDELSTRLVEGDENEIINSFSDEEKLAFAKDIYGHIKFVLNNERSLFDYGGLWLIDINEDDQGFVYYEADLLDDGADVIEKGDELGDRWDIELSGHPAIERLRSGDGKKVEFEIAPSDWEEDGSYYIAYLPIAFDGRVYAAIGLDYNWDQFHSQLIGQIWLMAGILSVGMASAIILMLWRINRVAMQPLSGVQKTVRKYMKDKDSKDAQQQLEKIKAKNEIGVLADDVSALVCEIDSYTGSIKALTTEVMEALARTIDAKDKYTNGHSFRVAVYSKMLAKELGMSGKEQQDIYYMGLLHDIGKIGIPNVIINKTSKLTDEEYEKIKMHPVYGYEILSEIQSMPELSIGARYHHERIDGKGYPDGLKGDEIPFMARIIAVADSYDTMTSNRSYRKYLPQDVVRAEIENNIGTQFDEAPARAMLKIIDADKNYMLHE